MSTLIQIASTGGGGGSAFPFTGEAVINSPDNLSTTIPFLIDSPGGKLFSVTGDYKIKFLGSITDAYGILLSKGAYSAPIMTFSDVFSESIRISGLTGTIKCANFRMGSETGDSYGGFVTLTTPAQGRFYKIVDAWGGEWVSLGGSSYDGLGTSFSIRAYTNDNSTYIHFKGYNNINPVVITDQAYVGIGTSAPVGRLDIKAQGVLSTDVALRVRNSNDTSSFIEVRGNGHTLMFEDSIQMYNGGLGKQITFGDAAVIYLDVHQAHFGTIVLSTTYAALTTGGAENIYFASLSGGASTQTMMNLYYSHLHLGGHPADVITGQNVLGVVNGATPTAAMTNRFLLYSADIVAGNAAPHFLTEAGDLIKLYKQDLATNPSNAEIATFLSNLGLANLL